MNIATSLKQTAEKFPGKVAVEFEQQRISFAELNAHANRVALEYSSRGISKGDRIAHFAPTSPELIYSLLGTFMNSNIVVPVNHQFKEVELHHILNDSGAKAIV